MTGKKIPESKSPGHFSFRLVRPSPASAPAQTRSETLQAIAKLRGVKERQGFAKALARREI